MLIKGRGWPAGGETELGEVQQLCEGEAGQGCFQHDKYSTQGKVVNNMISN